MKLSIILIFVGALFATTAKAGVFTTSPYAKVTWKGGSTERITWKDDNTTPLLKDLQSLTVDLYFGNNISQIFVTNIGQNIQGSAQSLTYTVPKNVGPPGEYFIRFSEANYQQSSGIFQINGVNGNTPTGAPTTALYAAPSISASGYNPYNSYSGATATNAITTPVASGTGKSSSSTAQSKTPPALSNDSNRNRIVCTNYLTLSSLILSTILLKYLL